MTYYSEYSIVHGYFYKCDNGFKPVTVKDTNDSKISNKPYKLIYISVKDRTHPSKHLRSVLIDEKYFRYVTGLKKGMYVYFIAGYSDNFGKKVFLDIAFTAQDAEFSYKKYMNHMYIQEDKRLISDLSYMAYQQQLQDEWKQAFDQYNDTFLNKDSGDVLDDFFDVDNVPF